MAELLSVPLKKPTDVDIAKPLKNLIDSNYGTADKQEDYSEQISEFSKLRNTAVWRAFEKYESSLEVIYSYYDQLNALEAKIPPTEVQIPFKWKDAFNKGSTFFGGRMTLTISSLAYEKVCVLFNIAALQSAVASTQSTENDEGLRLAAKLFQLSASIFAHLKGTVMGAIQQDPTPDLNPETLAALSALMVAQAQEIFVHKSIQENLKDAIIAKLSAQCSELYGEALKLMQKELPRQLWDRDWMSTVAGKQEMFAGMAEYYQSLVCKVEKAVGEEIARLQVALEHLKSGQQKSSKPNLGHEVAIKAQRNLTEAQKDNDFIYHERIPDTKSLAGIGKAAVAKVSPIPNRLSNNFKDLFESLVPMAVHQAVAAYDVRKNSLVGVEVTKLREATQLLNSVLASLNLPAALEDSSGDLLPQSLVEKSQQVCNLGGIKQLDNMIKELPELLQRNKDILDEGDRMLNDECQSDNQLREQFRERWTRTPSVKLTETFRSNAAKYREIINNAVKADKSVKDKYELHKRGMELLSEGPNVMQASVPTAGPNAGVAHGSNAAAKLRQLMEEVETMKAERDAIECELKSASADMKETFLTALSEGNINEQALSVEMLGRAYGPLQRQVKDSLAKQETLLAEIQKTNTEFSSEKTGSGGIVERREAALKELAAAHDAFMELRNNLAEGTKFYNDLTQLLVVFQNKISDFCFARKTEKEELLKDLTRDLSSGSAGATPNVPAHHAAANNGAKKEPPPRPPPPTALPYPVQPQGMPLPYAPASAAPYPAYPPPPMPAVYNPYATMYPPQQGGYQYTAQYNPYGTYPPPHNQQGQQPPHYRPW